MAKLCAHMGEGRLMALKATLTLPLIKHNPRSKLPTLRWRLTPMQLCSYSLSDHTLTHH